MQLYEIIKQISNIFHSPNVLLFLLFLIPLIIFLIKKNFVNVIEDPVTAERKRRSRNVVLFTRIVIVILLIVALAGPQTTREKTIYGDAYVQLLVDSSKSMELYADPSSELKEKLEKKINVEMQRVSMDEHSNLGDAILNSLQPGGSILVMTDGNANTGANLGDVALYASKLNTSINIVQLDTIKSDAGVMILGPSKTMQDAENVFSVVINRAGKTNKVHLKVSVDGETVFEKDTTDRVIEINREFGKGTHKLIAEVSSPDDYFPENNIYYKAVRVVAQPEILFISEEASPLKTLLDKLYNVEQRNSLPTNLGKYYAVVVNNMPSEKMSPVSDVLNEFITDGNGMAVFGGQNSYEDGNYGHSLFETLLPVFVGSPGKKEGDVNVALVIDISGSTGSALGGGKAVDVEKALAINAMHDLSLNTRLAVIVFNTAAKMISEPSYVFEKVNLEDKISRLKDGGGTLMSAGIMKAVDLLSKLSGSKNIILISDGKTQAEAASYEAAKFAKKSGIKIYTVGVGASTNEPLMMKIAEVTNAIYFRADEESRLRLLFGEPDDKEETGGKMGFVILNSNHFITRNLDISASIHGFNTVAPKTTARLLATTSTGEPILTISRLGLGRVASMAIDDGSKWAGELLSKKNSKILTRIINWILGDPERKSRSFIEAADTRINEPTEILIKSDVRPTAGGINFYKVDEDTYSASISPTQEGFQDVAGAIFAVNYPAEYENVGFNNELSLIAASTGGRIYDVNDVSEMVDNAKTKANRVIVTKEPLIWPFVAIAIVLFLLEIFIRRIIRKE